MHEFGEEPALHAGFGCGAVARTAPVTIFYSGPGVGLG